MVSDDESYVNKLSLSGLPTLLQLPRGCITIVVSKPSEAAVMVGRVGVVRTRDDDDGEIGISHEICYHH